MLLFYREAQGYLDLTVELGHAEFFSKILDAMEQLGWNPFQVTDVKFL